MRTFILAAAAALVWPATASAVVYTVNFDTDDDGTAIAPLTVLTDQYADWGVNFLGLENGRQTDIQVGGDPDGDPQPSLPNVLTNCAPASLQCPGSRADIVRILFDAATASVAFQVNSLGWLPITFEAYDASNNIIETQTVISDRGYERVSFSSGGIYRIDGLQPDDFWAWTLDDLTFDIEAGPSEDVPAPAALALLGLGVGVLGLRRRRGPQG